MASTQANDLFDESIPDSDGGICSSLSRDELDVLVFVATQHRPVPMSAVASSLPRTGLKNEAGRRFTGVKVKSDLQALESKGLVEMQSQGRMVSGPLRTKIFAEAFSRQSYRERAEAIAGVVLATRIDRWDHYRSLVDPDQIRLELMLYLGDDDDALRLLNRKHGYQSKFQASLGFLFRDFDKGRLAKLPDELKHQAALHYLSDAPFDLLPIDEACSLLEGHEPPASLTALLGSIYFLRGEETSLRRVIEELRTIAQKEAEHDEAGARKTLADARSFEACLEFEKGELEAAIGAFEESVKIEKGPSRKKKFCPRGVGGILFPLALCLRGGSKDLQRAQQLGKWCTELDETVSSCYGSFGQSIADCLAGQGREILRNAEYRHRDFLTSDPPNFNSLLFAIMLRLAGAEPDYVESWGERMAEMAVQAADAGYAWLAMEAAAFCADVAPSKDNDKRLETFTAALGIEGASPFSSQLTPPKPWEAQLKAMEAVAEKFGKKTATGTAAKNKAAARKEIIWQLTIVNHDEVSYEELHPYDRPARSRMFFDLKAIERSVSKTGRTTKGRAVSLKRLKQEPETIASLTDQDRAVGRYVKKEQTWGRREIYHLDDIHALLALAGHPLIFADAEATRPITLKRERVKVDVTDGGKGDVEVRLVPALTPHDRRAKLVRSEADHFVIYEISSAVRELANAFEGEASIKLPTTAKPRLINAISTLAGDLEIGAEGEIVGEGADGVEFRQVQGDLTPRLRLVPDGEGLVARLLVRPIAECDFTFAPGEGKIAIFGFANDERVQATRDLAAERATADALVESCPTLARHRGETPDPWNWKLDTPDDCLKLLRDLHPLRGGEEGKPTRVAVEWPEGETLKIAGVVSAASATISLGSSSDWLTLSGEVEVNEDLVFSMRKLLEFSELASQAGSGRGFIEIGKGEFLALSEEFQRQLDDLQALSQPGKGEKMKLPPLAALALEDFVEQAKPAAGKRSINKIWRQWIDRFREVRDHSPEAPSTLRAELRPYQLDGYRWLSRLARTGAGACLADDMGLGKTVQALALLLERADSGPSLVVAPTSVAANWVDETMKFAPTLKPIVFGAGDRSTQLAELSRRDLVICTYGLLQRESEALGEVEWNVIVLDEAQAIKNSATQRSRAARGLKGGFRVVTTGTPVENRLSELHTLLQFVLPGFLGSWERFRKRFADPIERDRNADAREHLRRLIQPFLLRRLKSNVLRDLPDRTEINLHVDLSEDESAFYEALRQRALEQLDESDESGAGAIQILAELTRLRRACCHPVLVDKTAGAALRSSKLSAFSETLDEILAGGHKVLVFSQFVDHLKLIRAELDAGEISYQYLDGSTTKAKRKQAVDAFQRGEGEVFLISLKAGGFGLNLTAADYVIHMDPWWNPATEDQASDRAHRIGQVRPVTIYRLITRGTIEEKIVELHHRKRELAESLLADSGDADERISPQQLLALIRE